MTGVRLVHSFFVLFGWKMCCKELQLCFSLLLNAVHVNATCARFRLAHNLLTSCLTLLRSLWNWKQNSACSAKVNLIGYVPQAWLRLPTSNNNFVGMSLAQYPWWGAEADATNSTKASLPIPCRKGKQGDVVCLMLQLSQLQLTSWLLGCFNACRFNLVFQPWWGPKQRNVEIAGQKTLPIFEVWSARRSMVLPMGSGLGFRS